MYEDKRVVVEEEVFSPAHVMVRYLINFTICYVFPIQRHPLFLVSEAGSKIHPELDNVALQPELLARCYLTMIIYYDELLLTYLPH